MLKSIHHVQLTMPKGGEDRARRFFVDVLGMSDLPKPDALRGRGGCWFTSGSIELHLGIEDPFAPARKAHPAFEVADLDRVVARLTDHGIAYRRDVDLPRFRRVFIHDPFGNRIELLQTTA